MESVFEGKGALLLDLSFRDRGGEEGDRGKGMGQRQRRGKGEEGAEHT